MRKPAICCNCKHYGRTFKLGAITHAHCEHPKYTQEKFENGEFSAYDTLQSFSDTCNDHEFKEPLTDETKC